MITVLHAKTLITPRIWSKLKVVEPSLLVHAPVKSETDISCAPKRLTNASNTKLKTLKWTNSVRIQPLDPNSLTK